MQIRVFKIPLNDAVPAHRSEHEDVTRNMTEEQKKLYTQFCSIRSRLARKLYSEGGTYLSKS